jgi:hypothetical protein
MHVVNNVTHLSVFSATHDASWLTQPPSEPGGAISPGLKITHVIPKASNLCRISLWIFYIAKNEPFIANLWWFTRKIQGCPTANCEKLSQGKNLMESVMRNRLPLRWLNHCGAQRSSFGKCTQKWLFGYPHHADSHWNSLTLLPYVQWR